MAALSVSQSPVRGSCPLPADWNTASLTHSLTHSFHPFSFHSGPDRVLIDRPSPSRSSPLFFCTRHSSPTSTATLHLPILPIIALGRVPRNPPFSVLFLYILLVLLLLLLLLSSSFGSLPRRPRTQPAPTPTTSGEAQGTAAGGGQREGKHDGPECSRHRYLGGMHMASSFS